MQDTVEEIIVTALKDMMVKVHESDTALFELIKALIDKTETLEKQVNMLMELHRVPSDN